MSKKQRKSNGAAGKGDRQRKSSVSDKELEKRWNLAFGKKSKKKSKKKTK